MSGTEVQLTRPGTPLPIGEDANAGETASRNSCGHLAAAAAAAGGAQSASTSGQPPLPAPVGKSYSTCRPKPSPAPETQTNLPSIVPFEHRTAPPACGKLPTNTQSSAEARSAVLPTFTPTAPAWPPVEETSTPAMFFGRFRVMRVTVWAENSGVGGFVGKLVGASVGFLVGLAVGDSVGALEGEGVGDSDEQSQVLLLHLHVNVPNPQSESR